MKDWTICHTPTRECKENERSTCSYKFGENEKVGFDGVSKHMGMDLKESFTCLASLKKTGIFFLTDLDSKVDVVAAALALPSTNINHH